MCVVRTYSNLPPNTSSASCFPISCACSAWFRPAQMIVLNAALNAGRVRVLSASSIQIPYPLFPGHSRRNIPVAYRPFCRVTDIVNRLFQRSVDRMVLCNRHISPSLSRSSVISPRYISPVELTRFAIWFMLRPIARSSLFISLCWRCRYK